MSVKILLINPSMHPDNPPRFWSLGMAYMTQTLKQAGYGVDFLDIDSHRYAKDFVSDYIAQSPADIIGIGGMALDVFDKEPYCGRLTTLDNVILTPHMGSYTIESSLDVEIEAAHN